jgi:hypothetical protein
MLARSAMIAVWSKGNVRIGNSGAGWRIDGQAGVLTIMQLVSRLDSIICLTALTNICSGMFPDTSAYKPLQLTDALLSFHLTSTTSNCLQRWAQSCVLQSCEKLYFIDKHIDCWFGNIHSWSLDCCSCRFEVNRLISRLSGCNCIRLVRGQDVWL